MVAKKRARSVTDELLEDLGIAPKPGEQSAAFLVRLMKKVNVAPDDVWEGLSEEAQSWYNDAATAREERQPILLPEGFTDIFEEELAVPEEDPRPKTRPSKKDAREGAAAKKASRAPNPDQHRGAVGVGRRGKFTTSASIKIVADKNPYRATAKAHGVWKQYRDGMTVAKALESGISRAQIRWDMNHNHIEVQE